MHNAYSLLTTYFWATLRKALSDQQWQRFLGQRRNSMQTKQTVAQIQALTYKTKILSSIFVMFSVALTLSLIIIFGKIVALSTAFGLRSVYIIASFFAQFEDEWEGCLFFFFF